jgi:hypothetical protein
MHEFTHSYLMYFFVCENIDTLLQYSETNCYVISMKRFAGSVLLTPQKSRKKPCTVQDTNHRSLLFV